MHALLRGYEPFADCLLTDRTDCVPEITEAGCRVADRFFAFIPCQGAVDFDRTEAHRKGFRHRRGEAAVHALRDISLTVEDGEIFGIIGLSGAGKSTLVRCINLLERPTSGSVIVDGRDLTAMTDRELRKARKSISMIFQSFNLLMQRSVLANVCFPMELAGVKKEDARLRAMELLELVELPDKANAYPVQLSGGQKQRVAIARALASDPKVLLCDEATSALDPKTTRSILALAQKAQPGAGRHGGGHHP